MTRTQSLDVALDAPAIVAWLRRHVHASAHLCLDSRRVARGDVFFACAGRTRNGRHYIGDAVQAGAAAVVVQIHRDEDAAHLGATCLATATPPPLLAVQDLTQQLGPIAHLWYGRPSHTLMVIAVTGTNGKTSTVQWLAAALCAGGTACGVIGTLGVTLPDGKTVDSALTTPDALSLHRSLALLRDAGARAVAIEASSIGIAQGRLDGVRIAFAGFTNLTHDHLDYHQNMAQYRDAKFTLFARPELRGAVVNLDDQAGIALFARLPADKRLGYTQCGSGNVVHPSPTGGPGTAAIVCDATVRASDVQTVAQGQAFRLTLPDGSAPVTTPIPGAHNVSNLLLVAGLLHGLDWPVARVAQALAALRPVPGRLQRIEPPATVASGTVPMVVVDYAHTPDALQRALQALRQTAQTRKGKLICVFGCGGDRDAAKRPVMGKIAAALADTVIVTSDNPRAEAPQSIVAQIVQGVSPPPRVVLERAQAILLAILDADADDVVLLAGKGHETWQQMQDQRQPFDDREWAALALTWRAAHALSQGGATRSAQDVPAQAVCTDTRTLQAGQLFVALVGEQFDGHRYLAQAAQAGATAAVVAQRDPDVNLPQFVVGDTLAALGHMAAAWRQRHCLPLIAVTGSNGKTTTKEMLAAILRAHAGADAVLVSQGNQNNAIGVPLTLLRLRAQHRVAVAELGMNHPGEIAGLAAMARPTVALVNNAQREHQEFMGTVQAVARENGAVLLALLPDGVAVYPGQDAYTHVWDALAPDCRRVRFGVCDAGGADGPTLDVRADTVVLHEDGVAFRLHLPAGAVNVTLSIPGAHNVHNALAAAACAHAVGVPAHAIAHGLADFRPVSGRMRMGMYRGMRLIDDSYNANPDSVRAAIDVLAQLPGMRTLVLGDMAEVGAQRDAAHAEVGAYARARGIQTLLTLGQACAHACTAFGTGARGFDTVDALVDALRQTAPAHVLVKGSRSMRMERVIEQLHPPSHQARQAHDAHRMQRS